MKTEMIQIDKAWRVVLPKPLRDQFNLAPGDKLRLSVEGHSFKLEPTDAGGKLVRSGTVLVFTGGFAEPITASKVDEMIEQERADRISAGGGHVHGKRQEILLRYQCAGGGVYCRHHSSSHAPALPSRPGGAQWQSMKVFEHSGHSLLEMHSILTRLPRTPRISAIQAATLITENIVKHFSVVTLTGKEYGELVAKLGQNGIVGGMSYDALHLACAEKSGADRIYTFNISHFLGSGSSPA